MWGCHLQQYILSLDDVCCPDSAKHLSSRHPAVTKWPRGFNVFLSLFQGPETWVGVRALRASSGGILDPDDRVRDVADDRETLTAECTQAPQPRAAQADGASGSSAGTASPDMFRVSSKDCSF